jgi:hypothetical protein
MSSDDRLPALARTAYVAAAWAFLACIVVQLFLVGLDVFEVIGTESGIHRQFAYSYGWLAPALVLFAAAGRLPRSRQLWTIALLVLFAIQTYLPSLAEGAPLVAAFHSINALAVFWLAQHIARHSRDRLEPLSTGGGS